MPSPASPPAVASTTSEPPAAACGRPRTAGATWKNVSDGFFGGSIGAVAVSEWDPNVIYAGSGEETVRGNVSHGDGMWKSTDAGKTWTHIGLEDSRHIARMRIHPKNPDLVYAAVLGHLFGPSQERGVYRSKDGGKTWERVLFVNENAGAVDLAMDPTNPRILYAGTWRVRRTPYSLESGGAGSGLWKSTDGGDSWTELTRNPGLPKGTVGGIGIIGVAVSPSNPENVYAIVEAEDGGVFRSRDGGKTWTKTNEDRELRQRAWYYTRIYADPKDEETVYVLNVRFHRSKDGGKTFSAIRVPHGDNHDLWIDPADPLRMIEGNDGGAERQHRRRRELDPAGQPADGADLPRIDRQRTSPTASWVRSRTTRRCASVSRPDGLGPDFEVTAGGESGYVVADPENPDVIYGGSYGGFLQRFNHATGEQRDVNVWPDEPDGLGSGRAEVPLPMELPHLLLAARPQHALRRGQRPVQEHRRGPDLDRHLPRPHPQRQVDPGLFGRPDHQGQHLGRVLRHDLRRGRVAGGARRDLDRLRRRPDSGYPRRRQDLEGRHAVRHAGVDDDQQRRAQPVREGRALRRRHDATSRTTSAPTCTRRATTAPPGPASTAASTRCISPAWCAPTRCCRGLLYAGTERGVYVSFDDGGRWQPLQLNLPIVPVTDMTVKGDDLVAATQGRGFWILGGLALLRHLPDNLAAQSPHLFDPVPAYRLPDGFGDVGDGGAIYYFLDKAPSDKIAKEARLEILDGGGKVLRSFPGKPSEAGKPKEEVKEKDGEEKGAEPAEPSQKDEKKETKQKPREDEEKQKAPMEAGLNRFNWDLLYGAGKTFPGLVLWSGETVRPFVVPGEYQVRLTVGGIGGGTRTAHLQVLKDPRSSATLPDLQAQHEFLMSIRAKLDETHDAIRRIRDVRAQLDGIKQRMEDQDGDHAKVLDAAKALDEAMTKVEEALYQTKNRSPQDPLNFPVRLNDKLNALGASAAMGDNRPTDQAVQVRDQLVQAIDAQLAALARILTQDLPAFNELAKTEGVPAVILSPSRIKSQP